MNTSEIAAVFQPAARTLDVDFSADWWRRAEPLTIAQDWRGEPAPTDLQTAARVLWNEAELIFGFECHYIELDIDSEFDLAQERDALWERDVCEAFVRSPLEPDVRIYKEFEVAPTGQWCDLLVDRARMWKDWEWRSGMQTVGEIDPSRRVWRAAMAVPFTAFGVQPRAGDEWHANLFRISRLNGERRYLSYRATLTESPNFHVPERFAKLCFVR